MFALPIKYAPVKSTCILFDFINFYIKNKFSGD